MQTDSELVKAIIHKHDVEGKGFRKTAQELGLKKSHAFNLYKKYASQHKERIEKKMEKDPGYQKIKSASVSLKEQVEAYEAHDKQRAKLQEIFIRKASTSEGLTDIFSSHSSLWDFASNVTERIDVWTVFLAYCKSHELDPKKKLFQVVGSLADFEYCIRHGGTDDLANHISVELEDWLYDIKEKENLATMQKRFRRLLTTATCLDCGKPLTNKLTDGSSTRLLIIEGNLSCFHCSTIHQMLCSKCKKTLTYQSEKNRFFCEKCKLLYPLFA